MLQLFWDASALVKRYYEEDGSETVDALFAVTPPLPMFTTFMGYAETAAVLRRRLNRGDFDFPTFNTARSALLVEVYDQSDFELLTIDDADVLSGIALTDKHNLNSTDAAILAAFLRYAPTKPSVGFSCILVASDRHLVRAAEAEGLKTLNPEILPAAEVSKFLTDNSR